MYKFKKDKYRKTRGNYSRLLNIYCRKCSNLIAVYQKDGSGNLRRLYLDRIFAPRNLTDLQKRELNKIKIFKCN